MKKKILFGIIVGIISALFAVSAAAQTHDYASIHTTMLNQDPDPAEPGRYVELRWNVQKYGNEEIRDLVFTLEADYPFSFDAGDSPEKEVGDLIGFSDEKSYYILYYKLRVADDALEDTYQVTLKYRSSGTEWTEKEYDVRVADKERPEFVIGAVTSSPAKLTGDIEEAELDVDLENIGDGEAQNVKVELKLPDGLSPSYSFADRTVLGTISEDSSKTATFYFDIDESVKGGIKDARLKVQYKESDDDSNVYKTIELPLSIEIMERPMFEVVSVEPKTVTAGEDVLLRIVVRNSGGKEAESVSLRAYKESSQPFEFDEKSDFIGKLEPGETGEAVLKFSVDDSATAKDYLLDVEARGIDGDQVIVQDSTIELKVVEKQGSTSPYIGALVVLGVVVVGFAAYFLLRRK